MKNWKTIVIAALVMVVIGTIAAFILKPSYKEDLAEAERIVKEQKANLETSRAAAAAAEVALTWERSRAETDRAAAQARIAWLEESRQLAANNALRMEDEKKALILRLEAISSLPSPEPGSFTDLTEAALNLYSNAGFDSPELTGNHEGAQLVRAMIDEIGSRRQLAVVDEQVNQGLKIQLLRADEIIKAQRDKEAADARIRTALEAALEASKKEGLDCQALTDGMQKQLDLYKKKDRLGWMEKPLEIAIAIAIFKVGEWYGSSH